MNPYKLADEAIKELNRYFLQTAEEIKRSVLRFDEVNALKAIDAMYLAMGRRTRKRLKKLFDGRFLEMLIFLSAKGDADAEKIVNDLLSEPNETTHYSYETEVLRKRDRLKEAVLSSPTKAQKQIEIDKALRYWSQMVGWYADFTSQEAEIRALKAAGVKQVQRHEMDDDKVCAVCKEADGEVYDIDKIPKLPHLRCRRWFTKYR